MRKLLILAAVAAALLPRHAFAIAASQAWVAQYVSNYVAQSAATITNSAWVFSSNTATVAVASTGDGHEMRIVVPDFTDYALRATNCTSAAVSQGVTNGLYFVWNDAGEYVNPAGTVTATPSNFVYRGVSSVATNGFDRFSGWFDVYGVRIQTATSYAITNATEEVNQ